MSFRALIVSTPCMYQGQKSKISKPELSRRNRRRCCRQQAPAHICCMCYPFIAVQNRYEPPCNFVIVDIGGAHASARAGIRATPSESPITTQYSRSGVYQGDFMRYSCTSIMKNAKKTLQQIATSVYCDCPVILGAHRTSTRALAPITVLMAPITRPSSAYCMPDCVLNTSIPPLRFAPANGTPRMISYSTPEIAIK